RAWDRPPPAVVVPPVDLEALIAHYRRQVARDPEDFRFHALLGAALIERARETADDELYALAEAAGRDALRLYGAAAPPGRPVVARVALARHDFKGAIEIVEGTSASGSAAGLRPSRSREAEAELLAIVADANLARGDASAAESAVAAILSIARTQSALSR